MGLNQRSGNSGAEAFGFGNAMARRRREQDLEFANRDFEMIWK